MEFSGEDFGLEGIKVLDSVLPEPVKNRGGRPTIGDDSLLGSRIRWLSFFEECWPDVGWPLRRIRKRRASTLTDVQKIFEPIRGKQRCEWASNLFLGGLSAVSVSPEQLIRRRTESSKLCFEVQDMQTEIHKLERSLREATNALSQSNGEDRTTVATEVRRRAQLVWKIRQIEVPVRRRDCGEREAQIRAGETYIYCSELLDFLQGKRRPALTPMNLANALAGLPDMRWRQSDARCSKMREKKHNPLHPYAIFLTIQLLCELVTGKRGQSRADSFRVALARLPQNYHRDLLCSRWRDLRLAIEEVFSGKPEAGFVPYVLTSAYLRNANRLKTPLDNVLDAKESVVLSKTKEA